MPRRRKSILDTNVTNSIFKETARDNTYSYIEYFNTLCELALSIYKWNGLPDTVDERFLELALLEKGYCLFFKDEVMGFLALPCMIGGRLNVYNIPVDRTAYASNGYQNRKTEADSVLIYNNELHTNDYLMIQLFAKRLWFMDQIIDINVNAQKTPVMVIGDQKQRTTLINLYQKYDGNAPFIFADDSLGVKNLQALNTGAPFIADKLYQLRTDIWNQALQFIGVSNVSIEKKERVITDEVQQSNAGTVNRRFSRLHERQVACERINKMFGLNLSVDVREDVEGSKTNAPDKDIETKDVDINKEVEDND